MKQEIITQYGYFIRNNTLYKKCKEIGERLVTNNRNKYSTLWKAVEHLELQQPVENNSEDDQKNYTMNGTEKYIYW